MLYASLISRALWWYREAAGEDTWVTDDMGVPSPDSSAAQPVTPSSGIFPGNDTHRCVRIKASSVTVGGFNIEDPHMQRAFINQLIRSEVQKVRSLIEDYDALASDPVVQDSYQILFSTLDT